MQHTQFVADIIEYMLSFTGRIYSLGKTRQYHIESEIKFTNSDSTVCIRPIKDGKISGYIRCSANKHGEAKVEQQYGRFCDASLLNGFLFEQSCEPQLTFLGSDGEALSRIQNTKKSSYAIKVQQGTPLESDLCDVDQLFKDMETNNDLIEMACNIKNKEKVLRDIGNFYWYWSEFNRRYNLNNKFGERKGIQKYVSHLTNIALLFQRNCALFNVLANSNLVLARGKERDVSARLQTAMNDQDKMEAVKWAALCVYALRNELFHENKSPSQDISKLISFLRDLIYEKLLAQYANMKFGMEPSFRSNILKKHDRECA